MDAPAIEGFELTFLSPISWSPGLAIAALVIAMIAIGALKQLFARGHLRFRQEFDDKEFGKTFFSGDRVDTAVRVRQVLADNLGAGLGGVRPDDRLNDDLGVSIESNVDLFFGLETEFDIDSGVYELREFENNVKGLVTFRDLVEFVHARRNDPGSRRKADLISDEEFEAWDAIGYAWFTGLGMTVFATMIDSDLLMKIGLTVAFLPVTLGFMSLILFAAREFAGEVRDNGFRNILEHPFGFLIWLAVVTPFALWTAWFAWGLFSLYFGGE